MKIGKMLCSLNLFFCGAVCIFGQTAQVVYDPALPVRPVKVGPAEEGVIKKIALPKARRAWKGNESCAEDFRIIDTARGRFTGKNSVQKAFLYEFCQTGNGWANNGLVIVEGGKIIAHFIEEGGWNLSLRVLPDVNKNGFDELVIETSGGMHQGKIGGSVTLLEVSSAGVKEFGYTQAFSNECDGDESGEGCDRSFKITVAPGTKPIFYREKFINTGDDEKPRWKKGGKRQKILLNKTDSKFRLLK